ncbi:hypothetical protein K6V72_24165 [Ralstonia insidiosa]|uniref:Uncharacterized protein n=1 Tax=Ralstonia insidiosa TaxID=190721 RepID=A0A191ZZS3_9RALS|nr:hypothetical protein [Ralstonia insidiosa]ANJ73557.1 hypothetical protein A9Y76_14250 [Ralstonia insidiosa]KAB0473936.1 hypothetical protein F7R11_15820 [Ralstonia insidiosa]MBY4912114.1 hypothetical protein [Ralstonia insidiosa]
MPGYTPSTDLDFSGEYVPPAGNAVDLAMPASGGPVANRGSVRLVYAKPVLAIAATVAKPPNRDAHLAMVKAVPVLRVVAHYDLLVTRPFGPEVHVRHQSASRTRADTRGEYQVGTPASADVVTEWNTAQKLADAVVRDEWQSSTPHKVVGRLQHQVAKPLAGNAIGGKFVDLVPHKPLSRVRWQKAQPGNISAIGFRHQQGIPIKRTSAEPWQMAKPFGGSPMLMTSKVGTPFSALDRVRWQGSRQAPAGKEDDSKPPVKPPYQGTGDLVFICPWLDYAGDDVLLKFGKYPCKEAEPKPPGTTIVVPVKRVYIVINNVLLRRVDGNVELPTTSLSLTIEADGWTWGFNAAIERSAEDAVAPASDGTPVELEAVINGTAYRLLADKRRRDREFGKAVVRVTGRGKSGILDAPDARIMSFTNTQARTAQQLMNDALTINGASIGWAVDWRLTDWLVPAGAWVHQGTYKTALQAIAGAAGAYIQPDPSLAKLMVLPRYPVAPWNWGTVTPDFVLPSDVTSREGVEDVRLPRYNRVFVSGQAQGILGQVTRAGTDGSIEAPMVTDALITHADAARQRGLAILGDTGNQALLSLRLPVLPETGIITPGKFVQYVDEGVTRIGIVRGTSVDVGMPEIWQTIGVETHVS